MFKLRIISLAFATLIASSMTVAHQQKMTHSLMPATHSVAHVATTEKNNKLNMDLSNLLHDKYVFALRDPKTGAISYTTSGNFLLENGYFMQVGKKLQGYPASTTLLSDNCQLSDVYVSYTLNPQYTEQMNLLLNLDSNSEYPNHIFDPNRDDTYNYVTTTSIFDSLGNVYNVLNYFVKEVANDWSVYVYINDVKIAKGHLSFGSNGKLISSEGLSEVIFAPTSGATSPQVFSISLAGSTQFGSPTMLYNSSQDGHGTLYLTEVDVDEIGYVNESFSNGDMLTAGKIAVLQK